MPNADSCWLLTASQMSRNIPAQENLKRARLSAVSPKVSRRLRRCVEGAKRENNYPVPSNFRPLARPLPDGSEKYARTGLDSIMRPAFDGGAFTVGRVSPSVGRYGPVASVSQSSSFIGSTCRPLLQLSVVS